jgi:hemolysin III
LREERTEKAGVKPNLPEYTLGEEIANAITHGVGTALSLAGTVVLVVYAALGGDPWRIASLSVYGGSLILLHLSSTLYHALRPPKAKLVFRVFDHGSIYLLIAGTYTPFLLVTLRGPWGFSLLGVVWGIAAAGITLKAVFRRFHRLSVLAYVLMGWLVVIASRELTSRVPVGGLVLLLAGGVAYTGGIAFYGWKRLPYGHAIWHVFVLAGSACHYAAVFLYVLPLS